MPQPPHASRRRLVATLLSAVLALAVPLVAPAAPAAADSTYLCTGYAKCNQAGFSHAGYATQGSTMWWRMYAGHNCTNYVAYRLVRSGMPNTRPWSGSGNASNWGTAMSSITNATPMVGAVAWWKANTPGAGSSGHVAYVEQVISSTEIVVSEDSWGGDFHWRRITKAGRGWPSGGFIHFKDATVVPTLAPAVTGTPAVGEPLTVSAGTWKPAATTTVQWLADGAAVPGATSTTFTPTPALVGKVLTARVGATRSGYVAGSATTAATSAVALGTLRPADPPTISGTPQVDETLVATPGTFSPTPATSTIQWQADGQAIPGATGWRLQLGQAQVDRQITAVVSAKATGYRKAVVRSAATSPVLAPVIEVQRPFTLTGRPRLGQQLTVQPGAVSPAHAKVTHTWLRDGQPIAGAGGTSYVLGPDDLGARISARVDLALAGYRNASQTLSDLGTVQTTSAMKVSATGGRRRATVTVSLGAAGIAAPTGRITLSIGARTGTPMVRNGVLSGTVRRLPPGRHVVRVTYAGTAGIVGSTARTVVRVRR